MIRYTLVSVLIAWYLVSATCPVSHAGDKVRQAPERLRASDVGVGRLMPDVSAADINGKQVRLGDFGEHMGVVVAFTSTSCPLSQRYAATLARLEKSYADTGIAFIFVDPIKTNSLEDARSAVQKHGLRGPFVRDSDGKISAALEARTTTEVLLLDATRTLIYRGAVDDQYGLGYALDAPRHSYLVDALAALLANDRVVIAATTAPGCALDIRSAAKNDGAITYHSRISRLMQSHCLECHRKGGVGPFALETYDDVVAHRGMIRKVVERGVMPPWFAAHQGEGVSPWANDRSLAAADKADLLAWFTNGQPAGDVRDAPAPRKFAGEWQIGEPDVVLQIPSAMSIKASGTMPYQHARIVTNFKEDKWVQAVEIRPTERGVVHHVLVFVPGSGSRIDETAGFFAAYVPGNSAQKYPAGFAKKLPAGASMILQLHYTPNGTATTDQTRIGLVFAKEPPRHIIRNVGIANRRISIPAQTDNHPERAVQPVPEEVQVLAFMPHMHLRGKAFRYDLVLPDGNKKVLLDVPRYDFNWQLEYRLAEPLTIPVGSRVEVTGWFDNSKNNPANPDPARTVRWGPQTQDEMLLGYVEYYVPSEGIEGKSAKPVAVPGAALITGLFKRADRNGDGKVTADELQRPELFRRLDRNEDGHVTLEEAQALLPAIINQRE